MAIALIIVLLCIMLCVMVYVIASLITYILKKEKYYLNLIVDERKFHKSELALLRNALTNDFLMKAELLEMNKDPKIAIPLRKVDVLQIPVENPLIMRAHFRGLRPDFANFEMKTMKSETIEGQYDIMPFVLRNPRNREQVKESIAKKLAEYLIEKDLIESAIDERNMIIRFRINVLT